MKLAWQEYAQIARNFEHKARYEDREDIKQDIVVRLAEVASIKTEPLTLPAMLRVASFVIAEYWRDLKRQPTIFSLNDTIEDDDGNSVELIETIADDKALDLEAWVDAKTWLKGCPRRLVKIAFRQQRGRPLSKGEYSYLERHREKELKKRQKALI